MVGYPPSPASGWLAQNGPLRSEANHAVVDRSRPCSRPGRGPGATRAAAELGVAGSPRPAPGRPRPLLDRDGRPGPPGSARSLRSPPGRWPEAVHRTATSTRTICPDSCRQTFVPGGTSPRGARLTRTARKWRGHQCPGVPPQVCLGRQIAGWRWPASPRAWRQAAPDASHRRTGYRAPARRFAMGSWACAMGSWACALLRVGAPWSGR
jgi:hypothetical protein